MNNFTIYNKKYSSTSSYENTCSYNNFLFFKIKTCFFRMKTCVLIIIFKIYVCQNDNFWYIMFLPLGMKWSLYLIHCLRILVNYLGDTWSEMVTIADTLNKFIWSLHKKEAFRLVDGLHPGVLALLHPVNPGAIH